MNEVHFVTVFYIPHELLNVDTLRNIKDKPEGWESHLYKRVRCWGWFKDKKDAEQCIKQNWTDIYECGYYNVALIETIGEGPCARCNSDSWYSVNYVDPENNEYDVKKIDKPKIFKSIVGFSYA